MLSFLGMQLVELQVTTMEGRPMLRVILAAALMLPIAVYAEIYKCTAGNGKLMFSDKPCPESATSETVKLPPQPETWQEKMARERKEREARLNEQAAERARRAAEWEATQERIRQKEEALYALRRSHTGLEIGMSMKDVVAQAHWQYADDISSTTTAAGVTDHRAYQSSSHNKYERIRLMFHNGRLISISD